MFGGILFAIVFIAALVISPNLTPQSRGSDGINTGGFLPLDPDDGRGHVDNNTSSGGPYSITPATSGPHWFGPTTAVGLPSPARWGRYETVIPDEILIHNLEHGGIGLHYNCEDGCPEIVQQLDDILPRNPAQYIMSPYPGMESNIAITAWRHHLFLDEFDEELIRQFIDEYKDRAPESVQQNSF